MHLVFAYLDAGSVSMAVTAIAGGVAGVTVYLKSHARGLRNRILRRRVDAASPPVDEAPAPDQG